MSRILKHVPAFGYKKYLLIPVDEPAIAPQNTNTQILENQWYKIITDPSKGTIISWYDKQLSVELIDKVNQYKMGEFILEQLGNRSQLESRRLNDFRRLPIDSVWFDSIKENEIWNSIRFYGTSAKAGLQTSMQISVEATPGHIT